MNNSILQIKFKQRLNKLASNDFDNIECWQIVEVFNKAQISWCRRQLHGTNQFGEGDEQSKKRVDDLQILLKTLSLTGPDIPYDDKYGYFRADNFGAIYDNDYLEYKRVETFGIQVFPGSSNEEVQTEIVEVPIYQIHGAQGVTYVGNDPEGWNEENASGGVYIENINNFDTIPNSLANAEFDENGYGPLLGFESVTNVIEGTGTNITAAVLAPGASKEKCCRDPRTMTVYLSEVANTDVILRDPLKNPDFEWGETFCTLQNNQIRIWRKDFFIIDPKLIYYRKPRMIQILGCVDPYTGQQSTVDIESEFKDDIVEMIIDEAVSIMAGDISDVNTYQRGDNMSEKNN
jgi:hypothetical protein